MTSETRINVDTKHLIPTAAVWQGPQLIEALTNAALKGFFLVFFIWMFSIVAAQTPFFNKQIQQRVDQFELCMARFKLKGTYTSAEFSNAHNECDAQATINYLQTKTR